MKESYFHTEIVTRWHRWSWYVLTLWFGAAMVVRLLAPTWDERIATWGIMLIFAVVGVKIVLLAELFRRAKLYRFWLLCYMLLVILLSTVLLKTYFAA